MKSVLLLRGTPTLKLLPHSCDLFEILCPALGGLVPTDLPRASYNQAIRNRFAAVWTSEHERSLETTCYFVNRESVTRCKESARRACTFFEGSHGNRGCGGRLRVLSGFAMFHWADPRGIQVQGRPAPWRSDMRYNEHVMMTCHKYPGCFEKGPCECMP